MHLPKCKVNFVLKQENYRMNILSDDSSDMDDKCEKPVVYLQVVKATRHVKSSKCHESWFITWAARRQCAAEVVSSSFTLFTRATFCSLCRASVTRRYCVQTDKHILKLFRPSGSPIILVFWFRAPIHNSNPRGTPSAGAQNTRGWKIWWFRLKSPFISETAHGYYGTLIGSRRWRIDTCQFRWPWVTPIPDFKVTV